MNIKEKHVWAVFLAVITLSSLFITLNVAVSTPIIFGDEGYFASRGEWIFKNLDIPQYFHIYSENRLYNQFDLELQSIVFLVSSFFALGGELLVKTLDPILSVITALMVFLLARKLYSGKTGVLSALFFLILPCVTTYAVFLYGDMLFTLFMVSSMYFLFRAVKEDSNKYLFISGVLGGFAIFTKQTGFLILLIYFVTFFFYRKEWLKRLVTLFLLSAIISAPWYGFHNLVQLGNPGIPIIDNYFPKKYISPDISVIEQANLELGSSGTYAGIFQYGILNYVQFSYGLGAFVFIVLGISYIIYKKSRDDLLIVSWTFLLFTFIAYYTGSEGKVESLSRWLIPVMPLFAIFAGRATEKLYEFLKGYGGSAGKIIGVFFVLMLVIFGIYTINTKATSLEPIKKWSPAFVNGCDWMRRNTPEDANIVSIWIHHGMYQCKRDIDWVYLPNKDAIVTYANDTSYELLKETGMDYIYFQKFSISFEKTAEAYPVEFVRYVKNSDKFEKVYEYPQDCMYSQEADCIVIYRIL